MLFKTRLAGKCYLAHRVFSPHTILFNCDAEAGLNQRFLKIEVTGGITPELSEILQGIDERRTAH
jgi:hypothetical protein